MMPTVGDGRDPRKIEELKGLIDDEEYLSAAIRRIAQVLSDELIPSRVPGAPHERER